MLFWRNRIASTSDTHPTNDAIVFVVRFRFEWMLSADVIVELYLVVDIEQTVATLNAVRMLPGCICMLLNVRHEFGVRCEELMAIRALKMK